MKLEFKKLAPYLPYGVKMKYCIENGSIWELDISNINAITEYDKLILRPLSDLTKEIEINGDKFVPIKEIKNFELYSHYELEDFVRNNFKYGSIESLSYQLLNQLFEWHFDIFGLIEQGLAIDINTIQL